MADASQAAPLVRLNIGSYSLMVPRTADVSAYVSWPAPDQVQTAQTGWVVVLGRYRIGLYLDARNDLTTLKACIDAQTKSNVIVTHMAINSIPGVTYGDYCLPITKKEWNFKKGETMICVGLTERDHFARVPPTLEDRAAHDALIQSIVWLACEDRAPAG